MKKAIIYYFSGTGNTLKACEVYREALEGYGIETTLCDICDKNEARAEPKNFELMGIAYPIHAFNAPYVVTDFAKKLPRAKGKKYFIIKTSGEPLRLNDASSQKLKKILAERGYEAFFERHYVMPYNMIFRHTEAMAYKMISALQRLAVKDVKDLTEGKVSLPEKSPLISLFAFALRIEQVAMKINGRFFKVDENKCVHCGKCVNNCPVDNITLSENGKFKFGGNCIMCTRCSFNCPVNAITIGILNGWKVNGKYSFKAPEKQEKDSHSWYCKKSYKKYFDKVNRE